MTEGETVTFAGLGLGEVTLRALDRAGFKDPSPIQSLTTTIVSALDL